MTRSSATPARRKDARLTAVTVLDLYDASSKALLAIDGILSAHVGQVEHSDLKAAFDALEAALNRADEAARLKRGTA